MRTQNALTPAWAFSTSALGPRRQPQPQVLYFGATIKPRPSSAVFCLFALIPQLISVGEIIPTPPWLISLHRIPSSSIQIGVKYVNSLF